MTEKEYILQQRAVADSSDATLGALCWWTIRNQVIDHATLEEIVKAEALEPFLPKPIRPCGAFRRATKMVQKDTQPTGEAEQMTHEESILVREVDCTDTHIHRKLVTEVRNRNARELFYRPSTHIAFDKLNQVIEFTGDEGDSETRQHIRDNYALLNGRHNGERLRVLVKNVVDSTHPTLIRPSGSVYFIPAAYQATMEKLERIIHRVNEKGLFPDRESTLEYMYVLDSEKHRQIVWEHFEHQTIGQVEAYLKEAAEVLVKESIKATTAAAFIERVNHIKDGVRTYETSLEKELLLCREKLRFAERQAMEILARATEVENSVPFPQARVA